MPPVALGYNSSEQMEEEMVQKANFVFQDTEALVKLIISDVIFCNLPIITYRPLGPK